MSLLAIALATVAAVGGEKTLSADLAAWDLCPIAWRTEGQVLRATGMGDLAFARDALRTPKVTVSAELTPGQTEPGDGWPIAGLTIGEDARNFWHLAFVQTPRANGGRHIFEVGEMRDGTWLSQFADRLPSVPGGIDGSWKTGETYRFKLEATEESVVGTVTDAKGKIVFRRGFRFDGKPSVKGGRPGMHVTQGFPCAFAALGVTQAGEPFGPVEAKRSFPPYESDSFVKGVSDKPTGFFRVKQMADGKWWVLDPLGRGTVIFGVDHVRWSGHATTRVQPMRQHYREHNLKAYPDRAAWETETLARLKAWGFNLLGAGSDRSLECRGLMHARHLSMGDALTCDGMPDEWYICPNEHRPCSALPNMFHPDFAKWCDFFARRHCAPEKENPWLLGYFIDNELAWWGRGDRQTGMWESVLKLPAGHPARQALEAYAAERKIADLKKATREEKTGFVRLAAERYFAATTAAIRKYDPNHLVLGSRFAGVGGAPDVVWEVSGRYCDLVTFNSYPFADLDEGVVYNSNHDRPQTLVETYAERQALVKRPMLITEWSFPALDSGLPCTSGAGQRFYTQKERAEATRLYAQTLLSLPYMIGYDYFMWVDEPPEGISDAFPEDSNYGLVSEKGVPYKELCDVFVGLQTDIGAARSRPVPAPKAAKRTGAGWSGLPLAHWKVNGKDVGDFTVMLSYEIDGARRWTDVRRVKSCRKTKLPDGELWSLVSEGSVGADVRFEVAHTMRFFTGRNFFLADVTALRNTGKAALGKVWVYFRTYAPYALEVLDDAPADAQNIWARRRKDVPNLWKGPKKGCWQARDGRFIGVVSTTDAGGSVGYYVDRTRRTQHPDAVLHPTDAPLDLKPGEAHVSDGRLWTYVLGGTDGEPGWQNASSALEKLK